MKVLKYGLTLIFGLTMLGFSAQVQAQASGQTANVVPANAGALTEASADTNVVEDMMVNPVDMIIQEEGGAQRGIATPDDVNALIVNKEYTQAVEKFEAFMKTAQSTPCNLMYLRVTFYDRLMGEDLENLLLYQSERDAGIEQLEAKCSKMAELYMLKERLDPERTPETTIGWMDKAIAADPHYGTLYVIRGDAHWALNQTEKACADYKKAKDLGDAAGTGNYDANCR